ncbi:MAG: LysE family transporter [Rhodobacter sp.]|nr:LysE family transporter [Paracoccaceae bacterium]MCC0078227.1 LysE family transporter [Rhodobacter sp.]
MLSITLPAGAFLTAWGFLAMNVATPGPNVLNTIALAIGSGRRAGLGAALGTALGITVWSLGMVLGVSALLATVPVARTAMTLVAIVLLLWFSSRYLRAARSGLIARRRREPPAPAGRSGVSLQGGLLRSLSILLANPKALTTWLTLTAIFPVARAETGDVALLCLGACAIAGGIHALYALAFSTPPAARAFLRAAPLINLGVGLFFGGFALALAISLARPI